MTFLPLPAKPHGQPRAAASDFKAANSGLVYNKFVKLWEWKDGLPTLGENKAKWVNDFAGRVGNAAEIDKAAKSMRELVKARQGTSLEFVTASPFVTGLGLSHPVENGFLWHQTLGVPYLAGSSVKGLIRRWAESWAGISGNNSDEDVSKAVWRLFGAPTDRKAREMGALIVFDALPLEPVELRPEVMTPHDDGWRLDGSYKNLEASANGQFDYARHKTPSDWVSPNPITFLTVAPGCRFLFSVAPARSGTQADVEMAMGWIGDALDWLGAGAKTASGFGRFDNKARKEAEKMELETSRAADVGDQVKIKPSYKEAKWHGAEGKIIARTSGGMLKFKAAPGSASPGKEFYVAADQVQRMPEET